MPNRIPTGNIPTPAVRKSAGATVAKKPVESTASKIAKADTMYDKAIASKKVKDLFATKNAIMKKTGVYPSKGTN